MLRICRALALLTLGLLPALAETAAENTIRFENTALIVNEAGTTALLTVLRDGTNGVVTVEYHAEPDTAQNGSDFILETDTLSFDEGETQKSISITIVDNAEPAPAKMFRVLLGNPSANAVINSGTASITIEDNDSAAGVDTTFVLGSYGTPKPQTVTHLATLPDGMFTLAGAGTHPLGFVETNGPVRFNLLFLNGTHAFTAMTLQSDGRLIAAGNTGGFLVYVNRYFSAGAFGSAASLTGAVNHLATLPDDSILIAGRISRDTNSPASGIFKASRTGEIIDGFETNFTGRTATTLLAAGDRFYAAFAATNETTMEVNASLERFLADGSPDTTFSALAFNGAVRVLLPLPDGSTAVGGEFTQVNGQEAGHLARFDQTGTLHTSPLPSANGAVRALALQHDQKLLAGGEFSEIGGIARARIARLLLDGSVDAAFDPGAGPDGPVDALALQRDGTILAGGEFITFSGHYSPGLVRLHGGRAEGAGFVYWANRFFTSHEITARGEALLFRTGNTNSELNLALVTDPGNVTFGSDIAPPPLEVTFAPGETQRVISLPAIADREKEGPEEFFITVHTTNEQVYVTEPLATIRIADKQTPGTRDDSFTRQLSGLSSIVPGPNGTIYAAALNKVLKLDRNGAIDPSFKTNAFDQMSGFGSVGKVITAPDGGVYALGSFRLSAGRLNYIARLTRNGDLDPLFESPLGYLPTQQGIGGAVLFPDGRLGIATGYDPFTVSGTFIGRPHILVLKPNGQIDSEYTFRGEGTWSSRTVALALSSDSRLLAAGLHRINGELHPVIEIDKDSNVNMTFSSPLRGEALGAVFSGNEFTLVGSFTNTLDQTLTELARVQRNGSIIPFPLVRTDGTIEEVLVRQNGKIVIGGAFTEVNGVRAGGLAQLNPDGSIDQAFNPDRGTDGSISMLYEMPDGKLLINGRLDQYNHEPLWGPRRLFDEPRPGSLRFLTNLVAVPSNAGEVVLQIERIGGSDGALAARLTTSDHNAQQGQDYTALDTTITFPESDIAVKEVRIPLNGTAASSADETFGVALSVNGVVEDYATILIRRVPGAGLVAYQIPEQTLIHDILVLPDESILVAGQITNETSEQILRRYLPDGSEDESFRENGQPVGGAVQTLARQADGKLLVGGSFSRLGTNSLETPGLVRFNLDYSIDLPFSTNRHSGLVRFSSSRLVPLADGGILTTLSSGSRIDRINPDGTADNLFRSGASGARFWEGPGGRIYVMQSQGIKALHPNGSIDPGFGTLYTRNTFAAGSVGNSAPYDLAIQPDGMVVIGGYFSSIYQSESWSTQYPASDLARVLPTGLPDPSFTQGSGLRSQDKVVFAVAVAPDGDILIGGTFTNVASSERRLLARLDSNGVLREEFNAQVRGDSVNLVRVFPNGDLLIAGAITNVSGVPVAGVARLKGATKLPPVVAITSPGSGTEFPEDDPVTVRVNAYDPDGLLGAVHLSLNGVFLETMTMPPFERTLSDLKPGTYTLDASAVDADQFTATAAPVTFTVANTKPAGPPDLAVTLSPTGALIIRTPAEVGTTYVLEVSEDLREWFEIQSAPARVDFVEFTAPQAENHPHWFYRVRADQ